MREEVLQKRLDRSVRQVEALEALIEDRARELFLANERLRHSRDELERVLDATPGPLLVLDAQGQVSRFNRPARELLDPHGTTLQGRSVTSFWEDWPTAASQLKEGPSPLSREVTWRTQLGDLLPIHVSVAPFGEGGVVCVGFDLRERKHLEDELRQAQKLESLGQLSASLAHEINTPLQFIGDNLAFLAEDGVGLLELVRALRASHPQAVAAVTEQLGLDDLDFVLEQVPQSVRDMRTGFRRVSEIVQALKTFSHPGSRAVPADFNACVRNALVIARGATKHVASVELELKDLPPVVCVETEVQQLVLNLVVNAAQAIASNGGPGHLVVRTGQSPGGVLLCVEDDGGGIAPEVQPRIFESFFTTKPAGQGTGQGLAMCQRLVEHAHGRLWFETHVGVGTRFLVEWPLRP